MMTRKEEAEFNAAAGEYRAEQARRETMANEGDVDGIWQLLTQREPVACDLEVVFPLLLRAIEARARLDPERFSSEILARIVSLTSYLALRSHFLLAARIEQYDRSPQGRGRVELPPTSTERVVPQLLTLHESLLQVLQTQATVARAWELARAKKIENDRAEVKPAAKATPRAKAEAQRKPGSAPTQANGTPHGHGTPANRIAGLLNGRGPKPNGAHHDD